MKEGINLYCGNCGYEMSSGMSKCPKCGKIIDMSLSAKRDDSFSEAEKRSESYNNEFIESDEYKKVYIKKGYLMSFLTGDGFKTEEYILTNKRLYYMYTAGLFSIRQGKEVVNIDDITAVKFSSRNEVSLLIYIIISFIFEMVCLLIEFSSNSNDIMLISGIFGVVSIFIKLSILILLYLRLSAKCLCAEYAGGKIKIRVRGYAYEAMLHFQKSIFLLKKNIIMGERHDVR